MDSQHVISIIIGVVVTPLRNRTYFLLAFASRSLYLSWLHDLYSSDTISAFVFLRQEQLEGFKFKNLPMYSSLCIACPHTCPPFGGMSFGMLSGGFPLAKHCHTSCPPTLTDKHHCTLPCSVTHPAPDKKAHISPDIQLYLDTDFPS
jgi:hypothetical protein